MKVTTAFLQLAGFERVKTSFKGTVWITHAVTLKEHPTVAEVIAGIRADAHATGYAKAQADMQDAAKAFLGPLGLLPDARAQQMVHGVRGPQG